MALVFRFTSRTDGDLSSAAFAADLASVAAAFLPLGLTPADAVCAAQVHGGAVRLVTRADRGRGPLPATDGLVTRETGVALVARGADCPLVLLHDPEGEAIAVLHAGWKGILAGVLTAGRAALGAADPARVRAWLGPCAGPCCYEVGEEVARLFPAAAVRRSAGKPRLDLPAAVEGALGLPLDRAAWRCTICSADHFSHRRDGGPGRHALIAALR